MHLYYVYLNLLVINICYLNAAWLQLIGWKNSLRSWKSLGIFASNSVGTVMADLKDTNVHFDCIPWTATN